MAEQNTKAAGTEGAAALTPEQEIEKLKADLATANADIAKKDDELTTAKAEIAKKDAALDASKKIITEQGEALAAKEIQAGSKHPVVTVDKVSYAFLGKGMITIANKIYPAKEVQENAELLAGLVKIGSGLLRKIKTKKGGK